MRRRRVVILFAMAALVFVMTLGRSSSVGAFINWLSLAAATSAAACLVADQVAPQTPFAWLTITTTLAASMIWTALARDDGQSPATAVAQLHQLPPGAPAKRVLPKNELLRLSGTIHGDYSDALKVCHRLFLAEMQKFEKWDIIYVRPPNVTYAPRGRAVFVGIVFQTKHAREDVWRKWDQTWFFRDGKLLADFDTSELGPTGAFGWCAFQEEVQAIYGPP